MEAPAVERRIWAVVKKPVAYREAESYLSADDGGFWWTKDSERALRFERKKDARAVGNALRVMPGHRRDARDSFAKHVLVDYISED